MLTGESITSAPTPGSCWHFPCLSMALDCVDATATGAQRTEHHCDHLALG